MDYDKDQDLNSYMNTIAKRIAHMEVSAEEMQNDIERQTSKIRDHKKNFSEDIASMKKEVSDFQKQASDMNKLVARMVGDFKRISRKPALERLQRKIDEWNPEKLATNKDLQRELRKLE